LSGHLDMHSICCLVKLFLRLLPQPLITAEVFQKFLAAKGTEIIQYVNETLIFPSVCVYRSTDGRDSAEILAETPSESPSDTETLTPAFAPRESELRPEQDDGLQPQLRIHTHHHLPHRNLPQYSQNWDGRSRDADNKCSYSVSCW